MRSDADTRRRRLIELMLSGVTPSAAAVALGIDARTVRRYLADAETAALLRDAQDDQLQAVARQSLDQADEALRVLREVAGDPSVKAMARVIAAGKMIDAALRLLDTADLAERVAELERQAATGDEGDEVA